VETDAGRTLAIVLPAEPRAADMSSGRPLPCPVVGGGEIVCASWAGSDVGGSALGSVFDVVTMGGFSSGEEVMVANKRPAASSQMDSSCICLA
jgi:hypothetical protein